MMKTNSELSRLSLLFLFCAALQSCSVSKPIKENNTAAYQLVFEDQFDGTAYNTKYWTRLPQREGGSPWNRYVVEDANLAEVKEGNLHIRARWNEETDLPETGAIQTKDKFSFKYGKIKVRAKFNSAAQGGWPAIWLMPQNDMYSGWPNGGEIDITERLNTDTFVHQSDGNA